MTEANKKLDIAIKLLDELDTTPLGAVNAKLDQITNAVVAAKYSLILLERAPEGVK